MQFPLKINRDRHVAAEHSDGVPNKLFPCGDCGVVFYTEEAQAYHSKSTHKRYVHFSSDPVAVLTFDSSWTAACASNYNSLVRFWRSSFQMSVHRQYFTTEVCHALPDNIQEVLV
jgi:hypothetical protein